MSSVGFMQICQAACRFINTPPPAEAMSSNRLPSISAAPALLSEAASRSVKQSLKALGMGRESAKVQRRTRTGDSNTLGQVLGRILGVNGNSPSEKMTLAINQLCAKVNADNSIIKVYQACSWDDFKESYDAEHRAAAGADMGYGSSDKNCFSDSNKSAFSVETYRGSCSSDKDKDKDSFAASTYMGSCATVDRYDRPLSTYYGNFSSPRDSEMEVLSVPFSEVPKPHHATAVRLPALALPLV
jgi:hypothetical protein